jgi:hypothetical protein
MEAADASDAADSISSSSRPRRARRDVPLDLHALTMLDIPPAGVLTPS